MGLLDLSRQLMRRCDELGNISEEPHRLTRTFASPAMKRATNLVAKWMRNAGLKTREDAAFNLIGVLPSKTKKAKTLLLGSHLDTVRDAGKYDGPLGVLTAIAAVQFLCEQKIELPFHLEIVGFSDEEGVRYQTTYLGSRAFAGTLAAADLARIEEKQIVKARRDKNDFLGYVEVHIEQGPVLEKNNLPVGVVTAIAGQSRLRVDLVGVAGHAGTVPMSLRRDALAGAAEFISAVENFAKKKSGLVATVGKIAASPGASNVIPGLVTLTLDVRDQNDLRRVAAVKALQIKAETIARNRDLKLKWTFVQQTNAVQCDAQAVKLFSECIARRELKVVKLPSGAGHDAVAISEICPVAMLFVRCKGGISHNPDESVKTSDVASAIGVLADFIQTLASEYA
jgi:allantoate deiminase